LLDRLNPGKITCRGGKGDHDDGYAGKYTSNLSLAEYDRAGADGPCLSSPG